jgi:hypothetical protein
VTREADVKPAEYVDQSASGLALSLIEGAIDIDNFTVFRTGTIGGNDVTVRAAIIGASHVLSFATGGTALTEMFACVEARDGASPILFGSLGDLLNATTELTFTDGRRYRFKASLVPLASPIPAALKRFRGRTARGARHIRLAFRFPRRADRSASPETIVSVRYLRGRRAVDHFGGPGASPNRVLADTAHCYPDERRVVVTSSELTWGRRA